MADLKTNQNLVEPAVRCAREMAELSTPSARPSAEAGEAELLAGDVS